MGIVYSLRCWTFKHEDVSQSPRNTYKSQNMEDHWKAQGWGLGEAGISLEFPGHPA